MDADKRRQTITLVGLSLVLGYTAFERAGNILESWQYCQLGFGIVAAYYWLSIKKQNGPLQAWWAILLLPLYALFQFAAVSIQPSATFEYFLRILTYLIIYLTVFDIALHRNNAERLWTVAIPIVIIAFLAASLGLLRYFGGTDAAGGAHGTFPTRNLFAGFLGMAFPLAIMCALRSRIFGLAAATIFTGILCSHSRGGFLSTLFSLSIMGFVLIRGSKPRAWRLAGSIAVLVVVLLMFVYLPPEGLFKRFVDASESELSTLNGRLLVLQNSPPLIEKYGILGCGLGGFGSAFLRFKDIFPERLLGYAHIDYLQALVELGLVGFSIILTLSAFVLRRTLLALKSRNRPEAVACLGAFCAIFLHSFVDYNLYMPAAAIELVWIAAITQSFRTESSA